LTFNNKMKPQVVIRLLINILVVLCLCLAGCSGGGGSGGGSGDGTTTPNASDNYISGYVYGADGSPLTGVTIQVARKSDTRPAATTGSSGYYYLGGLEKTAYSVTPSLTGHTFAPTSSEALPIASSVNFTAVRIYTPLFGLNLSPYMSGQSPSAGSVISESQIRAKLAAIAPYTKWVRSYAMNHGLENIARIAREFGLKTATGAWLSGDSTANAEELSALIAAAKAGYVDMAIVGSEVVYRREMTEDALIGYIAQFRNQVKTVPVTTAEPNTELIWRPNLVGACDVVFVNYYPYWNGATEGNAIVQLNTAHQQIVDLFGNKPIMVSESGWPSAGETVQSAVPSIQNASRFLMDFISWAESGVKCNGYFYFEAFDEAWKRQSEGERGAHWGIWDENAQLKAGMAAVFEGTRLTTNAAGSVQFSITFVPNKNSSQHIVEGKALGVMPSDFRVAVYILVRSAWWSKPYFATPLTGINYDGRWACDVVTGGVDNEFAEVAAFLVPANYSPPSAVGGSLPRSELMAHSLAEARAVRQ
jgi:exo-beta-1,3-glucanase (GH17 family)